MRYYVKTVARAFITLFVVVSISFFLYRLLPGGPVSAMRARMLSEAAATGGEANIERINRLVEIYTGIRPDQPIHIAYLNYMVDVIVYQDFGKSVVHQEPVFSLLFRVMPWSIFVSVYGLLLGFTTNVILGAVMANKEGSRFDKATTIFTTFLSSVPYYVGAVLMLAFLAYELGWFPTGRRYNPATTPGFNLAFMRSVAYHGTLPILTGFLIGFGGGALKMRGNSIRVMGSDYLRVARLRGLSENRIATRYIGRNALLPMYTGLMIGISGIFSSSVIMEKIFRYPGVGYYTFRALTARDYPLLMGIFIFYTAMTLIGVSIAELTYGIIDPRASNDNDGGV